MGVTSNLATESRLAWLRTQLDTKGRVSLGPSAEHLGVSEMTIRRDLLELENLGIARRVRGGAMAVGPVSFEARHRAQARAKTKIAAKLRSLVPANGAIGIDASSTMLRLVTSITDTADLMVVTNGLDTFAALRGKPGVLPMLTGGAPDERTGSLVGSIACQGASSILLSTLFVSAAALDPVIGSSEATLAEADVKRALASAATDIVIAVDSTKLNSRALAPTITWDRVTMLVTDLEPDDARLAAFRQHTEVL